MSPALPSQIRVIVRDWLSSNQIVLLGRETVVVDSGYGRDAQRTLDLLRRPQALGSRAVDLLANTHCHSDHMGGNAAIARLWGCPIAVPVGEAPLIARWDEQALWLAYADQRCERFTVNRTIASGQRFDWGGLDWVALAAPGHDMRALMFWCEEERVLISGDALWESGFGVMLPGDGREDRLDATRSTLETISELDAKVVVPGHGKPFSGVDAALQRARRRLDALAVDEVRMARSVVKTMFVFSLLDRGPMPAADLPAYFARVPLYAEYNTRYFRLSWEEFARWLVEELSLIGAVESTNGFIIARG